jgi:uncharacterized protein (TIGR02594 family)
MRLTNRSALAIGCAGLLALSVPAFALPAPADGGQQPRAQKHAAAPEPKSAQHAKTGKAKAASKHASKHESKLAAKRENRAMRLVSMPVTEPVERPVFGWPTLVKEARKYIGTNPTDRKKLWCATFMNFVLAKAGYAGTNSDAAKSFAYYGRRISAPQVGAIAVLTRGPRGGHVGVVTGIDKDGNPVIISGNHGRRVGEAVYPRARVIAYVMPTQHEPTGTQVAERAAPNHAASEPGIDSPITELLAAIEAEQNRADTRAQRAAPVEPPVPHRDVQQTPDASPPSGQASRRALPLDPALAEFLGLKERVAPVPPVRPAAQHPQRVQQRPGRVAAADTGLSAFALRR